MRYLQNIFIIYAFRQYIFAGFCICRTCGPSFYKKLPRRRAVLLPAKNLSEFFVFCIATKPQLCYCYISAAFLLHGGLFYFLQEVFYETKNSRAQFHAGGQHDAERNTRFRFCGDTCSGGGTVSPTALSETNSTGTLAFDQYGYPYDSTKGNEYETNHKIMTVVSSDGSWAYQKFTNSQGDVYILVLAATFSQDLTGQTINCQVISKAPTLTGGTYNGFVQLGSTNQKSDASGCTFNAPIAVPAASTTLTNCTANHSVQCAAADITLTNCTLNRNSNDSAVLSLNKYDDRNSAAGCSMTLNNCTVSCGVLVGADGSATINGGTYNIPGSGASIVATGAVHITGGEFTTQINARENGSVTIDGGTFNLGERKFISAFGGDITIKDGTFNSYLQAQSGSLTIKGGTFTGLVGALNGNITIEDGTFTGPVAALSASSSQYTGVLRITGGVFAKEPQGVTGSIYKLSAEGASFNGMASPVYIANETAVPQIEMTYSANPAHKVIAWRFDIDNSIKQHGNSDATDPRAAVLLAQANYQNSADNRTIRFDCVPSIEYNGYTMDALNADTVFSPVLDVLPSELTFHAATENGPASVELGADMPADRIDISCFYTNVATNEVSEEYPTEAGTYQISVILKAKGLSDELKNNIYQNRVEWNGAYHQLSYANESTGNTLTSLTSENWRFQISTNTVALTVDENGAPVIPADAKGVRYEGNTLTIDANTTARFAQDSTVKCDIVNNGTLDGGLFTGTVTGSGSIARGLFLHDPKAASNTMMLSVPENASLNGITAPDATGLTTLYAINTLDGENNELLFIGDYIGTDPHDFYGWDLVYSLGDEENSGVDHIGHTHFEQPMGGPIPDGMNGVRCTFLPVLEMDASDLTITADKTESKITGAVIESVQYVDESDPNAAPSTVYPTKAGKYKAIVTLTCPGDSTYSKARVARIGNLCYHVPETLEVPFTVEREPVQPELNIVNGLPDTTGMEVDAEGVYTSKNWSYNKNTHTLSVTNSSYFETFTGLVSCKVVAGEGVKISNGYFMDTVTFDGGTVDGGWFAKEPEGYAPSAVHSIAYADGTTEFTVNETLTVAKIWYGGPLKVDISTETPIYSVSDKYLPHQTTSLTYKSEYPRDYVLNSLSAPVLSTFTLSGVTDAYVMLDTTYRLDMTNPQELHEGVQVTVKADACDADHQVEWVATGLELSEEQKHSAELTFTMPGNAVTLTATYPSIHKVPPTDSTGTVVIPPDKTEVKGDGWTAKKDEEGKTTVTITDSTNLNNTTLNCDKITINSNTPVSNLTTNAEVTVINGSTIEGGTFSGDVSGTGTIEGGTFTGTVDSSVTVTGGVFTEKAAENLNAQTTPVTVTGGASINKIEKPIGEDKETTVRVVGEQQLSLAYTPAEGRTFYGWQKEQDNQTAIIKGDTTTTVPVNSTDSASVYTPVVEMNLSDIQNGESNIEGTAVTSIRYYKVDENGQPVGDGYDNAPVDDGTFEDGRYVQFIALALTDAQTENTISMYAALYADEDALSRVVVKNGIGYYVPEFLATGEEVRIGDIPDDTATGSGDSGAGGAAVAVIGGAAIGGAAYLIGTQVYLTSVLPEGASIPTNRQQLADLLWTAAGKPQPASTALFTDISAEATDSQKAARWCVEQGLLKDTGSTFKPDKHTFRPQVIKAWNDLQAKLNPQK